MKRTVRAPSATSCHAVKPWARFDRRDQRGMHDRPNPRATARTRVRLACGLLVALAMGTGAVEAQTLKVSKINVSPTPFALGDLTLSCVLRNVGNECVTADSASDPGTDLRRPTYAFRISDDTT